MIIKDTHKTNTESGLKKPDDAFVVHRTFSVPTLMSEPCIQTIRQQFTDLDGLLKIVFDNDHKKLQVTYDSSKLGYGDIERLLSECGYPASNSLWFRYKSSWYRYVDDNARTNAKSKGGACCSNPSDIYAKRHK